jgi:hypothetical protein
MGKKKHARLAAKARSKKTDCIRCIMLKSYFGKDKKLAFVKYYYICKVNWISYPDIFLYIH